MNSPAVRRGSKGVVEALLEVEGSSSNGYRWINLRRSSLLVPTGNPRAVGAALLRRSARTPRWSIAGRRVIAGAMRAIASLTRAPANSGTAPPLVRWLENALNVQDLVVVSLLGPPRPNDKPVLQVLDSSGATLAWAKVGWTPLTRQLVEHETQMLNTLTDRELPFDVPLPIASTIIDGYSIALHSALPVWTAGRKRCSPKVDWLTVAVSSTGTLTTEPFGETEYLAGLNKRIELVASVDARATLSHVVDRLVGEHASVPLKCGRSHGDLSAWNLDWRSDKVLVWDWERAQDGLPVGIDAIHYAVQQKSRLSLADLARAEALRCAVPVGQVLTAAPILERAYFLELFLRREEEHRRGQQGSEAGAATSLLARLAEFA
ncbi:MAG: hypothetical protein EXQ69_09865 [Acidimicrobiia bacterium]|nr:hypothetical protein [Acidimicrobiia bacterium]